MEKCLKSITMIEKSNTLKLKKDRKMIFGGNPDLSSLQFYCIIIFDYLTGYYIPTGPHLILCKERFTGSGPE